MYATGAIGSCATDVPSTHSALYVATHQHAWNVNPTRGASKSPRAEGSDSNHYSYCVRLLFESYFRLVLVIIRILNSIFIYIDGNR